MTPLPPQFRVAVRGTADGRLYSGSELGSRLRHYAATNYELPTYLARLLGLPLFATPAERFLAAIHTSPQEVPPQLVDEWRQAKRFADAERFVRRLLEATAPEPIVRYFHAYATHERRSGAEVAEEATEEADATDAAEVAEEASSPAQDSVFMDGLYSLGNRVRRWTTAIDLGSISLREIPASSMPPPSTTAGTSAALQPPSPLPPPLPSIESSDAEPLSPRPPPLPVAARQSAGGGGGGSGCGGSSEMAAGAAEAEAAAPGLAPSEPPLMRLEGWLAFQEEQQPGSCAEEARRAFEAVFIQQEQFRDREAWSEYSERTSMLLSVGGDEQTCEQLSTTPCPTPRPSAPSCSTLFHPAPPCHSPQPPTPNPKPNAQGPAQKPSLSLKTQPKHQV